MNDRNRLLLAAAVLLHAAFARWQYTGTAFNIDFLTLWSVPHALSAPPFAGTPTPNIYEPDTQHAMSLAMRAESERPLVSPQQVRATQVNQSFYNGRVDATGTPFIYALVGLTSSGDFVHDSQRFEFFSFVCFLAATALWCWMLRFTTVGTLLALGFFGCAFAPVLMDITAGNISQVQLLPLALFAVLFARDKPFAAGAALGLALALKPNLIYIPAIAAVALIMQRQFTRLLHLIAGAGAAIALAAVTSAAYFGTARVWLDFLASVPRTLVADYSLERGNYGLISLLDATLGVHLGAAITLALLVLVVVLFSRRRTAPLSLRDQTFVVLGLGGAMLVLASSLAWVHYYAFMIPVALYLLRPVDQESRGSARWIFVLTLVAVCLMTDVVQQVAGASIVSIVLNVAVCLLVVALLLDIWPVPAVTTPSGKRHYSGRSV